MSRGLCEHCRNRRFIGIDGLCRQCRTYINERLDRFEERPQRTAEEKAQDLDDLFGGPR